MRAEAIPLEEHRLRAVTSLDDYRAVHERHRLFPAIFEKRGHDRIIDLAAGVGIVGKNIRDRYPAEMICNDISPTCLRTMKKNGLATVSFDLDDCTPFPLEDASFDAVIALATIEHLVHIDHFVAEIRRILKEGGHLYLSAPNYSGIPYLIPFLTSGRTFHNPLNEADRYEFYAHIRYFTYRTLLEFVGSFNFAPETVYLALPAASSRFRELREKSPLKAAAFRWAMGCVYRLSPRWASEPVICFRKEDAPRNGGEKLAVRIM